ncbi:MAG: Mth938-like domain-containing protein [Burkholderiaceae bacterium]|nr:Mth938-like domain-containing protein [Burkholderiaceae bacterium]
MKFQPDSLAGTNTISRHERGQVWVNGVRWGHSVLVPWRGDVRPWPLDELSALAATHFEQVLALKPELVIFGSGERLQFVAPATYRALIDARIGLETMDTAAACRTYNVLASEGRSVVAALLLPPKP